MFFKKAVFVVCLLFLFAIPAKPELFIVKEANGNVVPLDVSDWDNYKGDDGIFGILQKYQWPMNTTVSDLKKDEMVAVFGEKPYAERDFIQKRIQEAFPDEAYKVVFIPTTLYELFAILMMHKEPFGEWKEIRKTIFGVDDIETYAKRIEKQDRKKMDEIGEKYSKDRVWSWREVRDRVLNIESLKVYQGAVKAKDFDSEYKEYGAGKILVNELIRLGCLIDSSDSNVFPGFFAMQMNDTMKNLLCQNEKRAKILRDVYSLYTTINKHEESKKAHFLLNWYIGHHMSNTYQKKDFHAVAGDIIAQIDPSLYWGIPEEKLAELYEQKKNEKLEWVGFSPDFIETMRENDDSVAFFTTGCKEFRNFMYTYVKKYDSNKFKDYEDFEVFLCMKWTDDTYEFLGEVLRNIFKKSEIYRNRAGFNEGDIDTLSVMPLLKGMFKVFCIQKIQDDMLDPNLLIMLGNGRGNGLRLLDLKEKELSIDNSLKKDGVVAKTIDMELLAQEKNAGLLFRGTALFEKAVGMTLSPEKLEKGLQLGSSLKPSDRKEPASFAEVGTKYKEGGFSPFSISFGNSLFAGFFWDGGEKGATVYGYVKNDGVYEYALTINKAKYVASLKQTALQMHIEDLFFITPVSTLSGLFGHGEFFHPRVKACTTGDPSKGGHNISQLQCIDADKSGLFLIKRDPFKHERMFAQYVADNAHVIKVGDKESLLPEERIVLLKENQKKAATFYGAIPAIKRFVDKVKSSFQTKIQKYTTYGDVYLKKGYQKRESLLGFNDKQAFPGDASYSDLPAQYDENTTVQEKFCVVETPPVKAKKSFRIMSFNVHNFHRICGAKNGLTKNPDFACATISTFNPDVALLQEIVPYVQNLDEAKKITSKGSVLVDFTYLDKTMSVQGFVENIKINDFEYKSSRSFMGKAIYTKNNAKILDFDNGVLNDKAPDRGYIRILFSYPKSDEKILIYTVHLSYGKPEFTQKEIETLLVVIRREAKLFGTKNIVIMGDFNNSPYKNSSIFDAMNNDNFVLLNDSTPSSFASKHTGVVIDLAWVSRDFLKKFRIVNPAGEGHDGKKYKLVIPSDASDHWPIYIDFELKKETEKKK